MTKFEKRKQKRRPKFVHVGLFDGMPNFAKLSPSWVEFCGPTFMRTTWALVAGGLVFLVTRVLLGA